MRIVVASDLTDPSADAARYAVKRARLVDADLTVAHVVGSNEIDTRPVVTSRYQIKRPAGDPESLVDEFEARKIAELRDWFTDVAGDLAGVSVSYSIAFGDLPTVIWHVVDEVEADSLIVGAHGTGSVGRHLSRILLDATIPVVVVRHGILPAES